MRIAFIGGTGLVGVATAPLAAQAGDELLVAHSGDHEGPADLVATHLHGPRSELLAPGGPVERAEPDVLVDSFMAGPRPGASAAKARELLACAARCGARRVVAISSVNVYRYSLEAGLMGGYGAVALPSDPIPVGESWPLREPRPDGAAHDNVPMERALQAAGFDGAVTVLRVGLLYGRHLGTREAPIVAKVRSGERRLELPGGGGQFFARTDVQRVARAVHAATRRSAPGVWACNVVDPYGWTYAGLAAEIGRILDWEWEPIEVPFVAGTRPERPFAVTSPCVYDDRRLREDLGVTEPDPRAALEDLAGWLMENVGPAATTSPAG